MTYGVGMKRGDSEVRQVSMGNPLGLKESPPPSMAKVGLGLNIKSSKPAAYDPSTDTALQATIGQTRDLAEQLAAKRNARRGGGRQLLSDSRSSTLG